MKVVQVNAYNQNGSTGKICSSISDILNENEIENYVFYTQGEYTSENAYNYNIGKIYTLIQSLKSKVLGNNGFNSKKITLRLISEMDKIKPDIVHIHNVHAQNLNLELFFTYLKKNDIKVVITFHDCWLLTGYCMHFDMRGCQKWQYGCGKCEFVRGYSWLFDRSNENWEKKLNLISSVNPTITAPSMWMANIIRKTKIAYKSVCVIYNGINLDIFYPRKNAKLYNIPDDKYIVLGVADRWDEKKGIDVFVDLASILDERFQIVLVGTNKHLDKRLPSNIISIHRTTNQDQLAEIYSRADVYVNVTREEVLGLVNIEALACGTPVITFNTGGSPECIDEKTGYVVEKNDIENLVKKIEDCCLMSPFNKEDCVKRAQMFDEQNLYQNYLALYKKICSR